MSQKVSYKASKAWHLGHTLATDIYRYAVTLYQNGQGDLATIIHELSRSVPHHIADAHKTETDFDRDEYYNKARSALSELDSHFIFLRELDHLSADMHADFTRRSQQINRLLGSLMMNSQLVLEPSVEAIEQTAEEIDGNIIDNQPEEGSPVRTGGDAVPSGGLQPESDGARRINRQRANQKFTRWEGPRKNF